jgi:predicted site-specific integrase-resolvase
MVKKQIETKLNKGEKGHATRDICELFDISRATLFRWEREGRLSAVWRDWRNWRLYSEQHIEEIRSIVSRDSRADKP